MLKAYAVALVLSTSTQASVNTQESARPLDKKVETSTQTNVERPRNCKLCRIRR